MKLKEITIVSSSLYKWFISDLKTKKNDLLHIACKDKSRDLRRFYAWMNYKQEDDTLTKKYCPCDTWVDWALPFAHNVFLYFNTPYYKKYFSKGGKMFTEM